MAYFCRYLLWAWEKEFSKSSGSPTQTKMNPWIDESNEKKRNLQNTERTTIIIIIKSLDSKNLSGVATRWQWLPSRHFNWIYKNVITWFSVFEEVEIFISSYLFKIKGFIRIQKKNKIKVIVFISDILISWHSNSL